MNDRPLECDEEDRTTHLPFLWADGPSEPPLVEVWLLHLSFLVDEGLRSVPNDSQHFPSVLTVHLYLANLYLEQYCFAMERLVQSRNRNIIRSHALSRHVHCCAIATYLFLPANFLGGLVGHCIFAVYSRWVKMHKQSENTCLLWQPSSERF